MHVRTIFPLLLVAVACGSPLVAQTLRWTHTYGGPGQDGGESMVLGGDGGLVIAGFTSATPFAYKDVFILKTSAGGDSLWSRTYSPGMNDIARAIRRTTDGGYIIAGMTEVNPQTFDPFLIKTDSMGVLQWQRQYDFGFGDDDRGHGVWQTTDGGYIVVGQTWLVHGLFGNYDMYVIKTDAGGNVQWTRIFYREEEGGDVALAVQQLADGGYIIGGFTQSSEWASYVVRTDSSGDSLWTRIYPGAWQSECYDIQAAPGGGFVLTGTESSFDTDTDLLLMKLDAQGGMVWKKIHGTVDADQGESFEQLEDGGYIVAGMSANGTSGYDVYVVRTDSSGDTVWTRTVGGLGDDRSFSVVRTAPGSYVVTGWSWSFGQGVGDVYLLEFGDSPLMVRENSAYPEALVLHPNYPNPFNPATTIEFRIAEFGWVTLRVYDVLGREIATLVDGEKAPGRHTVEFDATGLPSGTYLACIRSGNAQRTGRLVLVK